MKTYLLWLPAVVIAVSTAMYRPVKEALTEKPSDKSISVAIYKGNSYAADIYSNTSAKLHITIEKVNGNCRTQVWSQTLDAKMLKEYPSAEQALAETVMVPKVFSKENLQVTYTITYDSDGSELQMQSAEIVSGNTKETKLSISI